MVYLLHICMSCLVYYMLMFERPLHCDPLQCCMAWPCGADRHTQKHYKIVYFMLCTFCLRAQARQTHTGAHRAHERACGRKNCCYPNACTCGAVCTSAPRLGRPDLHECHGAMAGQSANYLWGHSPALYIHTYIDILYIIHLLHCVAQ